MLPHPIYEAQDCLFVIYNERHLKSHHIKRDFKSIKVQKEFWKLLFQGTIQSRFVDLKQAWLNPGSENYFEPTEEHDHEAPISKILHHFQRICYANFYCTLLKQEVFPLF